jgi:hypothetical protein
LQNIENFESLGSLPHHFRCSDTGVRFIFGELGLRLLSALAIRNQNLNLDAEFSKPQNTLGYNNRNRSISRLVQEMKEKEPTEESGTSTELMK